MWRISCFHVSVPISERRQSAARQRVYYEVGDRVHPGDLLFQGKQPVLVVSWRTVGTSRLPYIYFALDPALLKPVDAERGHFRYQGVLFDSHKATSSLAKQTFIPAK
jgi:hypothetical protein